MLVARYLERTKRDLVLPEEEYRRVQNALKKTLKEEVPNADKRALMAGHLANVNRLPFQQALREVCKSVGSPLTEQDVARFAKNRNKLVHAGFLAVSLLEGTVTPRERWDEYSTRGEERLSEIKFMESFVGTIIFCALGGTMERSELQ